MWSNVDNISNNIFKVGIYARLSDEDKYKKNKEDDSESITNQKDLLIQYVKENNYQLVDIYVDDGYSGTNFNRPEFKRMISDAEDGKINMIITKDMSRLGRDYIETGKFIEKYFPEHGIRYVAVTDNVDTFIDGTHNDIAPFKAIMNDMYAKDISKKIRSTLNAMKKSGKYMSGRPPFGYDLDPNDKKHLIVNEEKAEVVKRIFELFLEGNTFYMVAEILTNERVKTPAQYFEFKWNYKYNTTLGKWNAKTIEDIIKNQIYIGDMVQGKRRKVSYKVNKIVRNNPCNYIIVSKTHEPIIDKEVFFEAQKLVPKNVGRKEKKENHLLDGLLYCGNCGHRISVTSRRKDNNQCYTICNHYRAFMKQHVCTTHSNNYDKLEKCILEKLINECKKNISINKISSEVKKINIEKEKKKKQIKKEKLKKELDKTILNLDDAYIDKISGKINEEMYNRVKEKLEEKIENLKRSLGDFDMEKSLNNEVIGYDEYVKKFISDFLNQENPSRDLIVKLIDKIYIYEDKRVDLKLCFNNKI